MHSMHHLLFTATLLLVTVGGARADIVDIRWSTDGSFSHQGTIAAGKSVEVCGKLAAGSTVHWEFNASVPVDFNVHYHVGKDVVFPFKLSAVANAKDSLDARIGQDYCWTWINKSAAVTTLSVSLRR